MTVDGRVGPVPLVSLITPAYNEEAYLAECLDSVLAQTYPRWELTVVDNASSDRTLEIAREYAARDSRIKVHDNEQFLPQLANMNAALARIPSDSSYVKMVLADDWIHPTCLTEMVRVVEDSPTIGLVCSYVTTEDEIICRGLPPDRRRFSGAEVCRRQLLRGDFYFGSPTSQLWRASIVRERRPFFQTDFHADTDACYDVLGSHEFGFVHQVLSFRRTANVSVTSRLQGFNTEFTDGVVMLARYGPRYLDPPDFTRLWNAMYPEYRRFIGESLLRREGREFWEHHRRALRAMGRELTMARRVGWAAAWAGGTLLRPRETFQRLKRRVVRRSSRG